MGWIVAFTALGAGAAGSTLRLEAIGNSYDPTLVYYLAQKITAATSVTIVDGAPADFTLTVAPAMAEGVILTLRQDERLLTQRLLNNPEPAAVKAAAWLTVRSALTRALAVDAPKAPAIADAPEAAETPVVAPEPQPPRSSLAQKTRATPSHRRRWRYTVVTSAQLGAPRLTAYGVAAGASLPVWEGLRLRGSVGYRHTPGPPAFSLHAAPVTAALGWRLGQQAAATLELEATVEPTWARGDTRGAMMVGVIAGPAMQVRIPVLPRGPGAVLRFGLGARLVRHRFTYDTGETTETPWRAELAVGATWP